MIIILYGTILAFNNNRVINILCSSGKCLETGCVITTFQALEITIFGCVSNHESPCLAYQVGIFLKYLYLKHTEIAWVSKLVCSSYDVELVGEGFYLFKLKISTWLTPCMGPLVLFVPVPLGIIPFLWIIYYFLSLG